MLADLGAFIFSVFDHWLELLSGCVLMVVIALFEKFVVRREVSVRVYQILLVCLLFWACFLAWKDQYKINKNASNFANEVTTLRELLSNRDIEIRDLKDFKIDARGELNTLRHERDDLRRELEAKSARLEDKQKKQRIRDKLSNFLGSGNALLRQCLNAGNPPWPLVEKWIDDLQSFAKYNMDRSSIEKLADFSDLSSYSPSMKSPSPEHTRCWEHIHIRLQRVHQFVDQYQS